MATTTMRTRTMTSGEIARTAALVGLGLLVAVFAGAVVYFNIL